MMKESWGCPVASGGRVDLQRGREGTLLIGKVLSLHFNKLSLRDREWGAPIFPPGWKEKCKSGREVPRQGQTPRPSLGVGSV